MALTALGGPLIVFGRPGGAAANAAGPYVTDYDPDQGPSPIDVGVGLLDPRLGYFLGGNAFGSSGGETCAYIFQSSGGYVALDQAPSTASNTNIAAAANVTNGTAMTLVSSSGAGITVPTAATTILNTGNVVPSTALIIDSAPTWITFGQNKTIAVMDPRTCLSRCIAINGSASAAGGAFACVYYDLYGVLTHETITHPGGNVVQNGKKAAKFVVSITPQFTDAHNYSVGTADIFGLPLRADEFCFAQLFWNNALMTANTGFTAADATSPATATTGDVRGTYATQSASDGTKKLQAFIGIPPWNALDSTPGAYVGRFGVTQF